MYNMNIDMLESFYQYQSLIKSSWNRSVSFRKRCKSNICTKKSICPWNHPYKKLMSTGIGRLNDFGSCREKEMWFWQTILNLPKTLFLPTPLQLQKKIIPPTYFQRFRDFLIVRIARPGQLKLVQDFFQLKCGWLHYCWGCENDGCRALHMI